MSPSSEIALLVLVLVVWVLGLLETGLWAVVLFMLLLDAEISRRRPGRFMKKYSQATPRLSHLEHVGFSLGHLTLETAHEWQQSRSLELVAPTPRADGCPCVYGIVLP